MWERVSELGGSRSKLEKERVWEKGRKAGRKEGSIIGSAGGKRRRYEGG